MTSCSWRRVCNSSIENMSDSLSLHRLICLSTQANRFVAGPAEQHAHPAARHCGLAHPAQVPTPAAGRHTLVPRVHLRATPVAPVTFGLRRHVVLASRGAV